MNQRQLVVELDAIAEQLVKELQALPPDPDPGREYNNPLDLIDYANEQGETPRAKLVIKYADRAGEATERLGARAGSHWFKAGFLFQMFITVHAQRAGQRLF